MQTVIVANRISIHALHAERVEEEQRQSKQSHQISIHALHAERVSKTI